ncbi:MAG: family 16 glycosylhydrolase [Bryobacteraceae bacterium]|jgi:uncharacterized protein (TIGR03437 family)
MKSLSIVACFFTVACALDGQTATPTQMLLNGGFENGLKDWQVQALSGALGTVVASTTNPIDGTASAELTVSNSTGTNWDLQLQQPFNMTLGRIYTISFKAVSSAPVSLQYTVQQTGSPYAVLWGPTVSVGTTVSTFQTTFTSTVSAPVGLNFYFGDINPSTLWLDDVSVLETPMPTLGASAWQLVWSDEFNGAVGTPPNPANWDYYAGPDESGSGNMQTYTNSLNNVYQDGNGNLVIKAIKDAQGNYTSAQLQTGSQGATTNTANLSWQYGLVTARIKLPYGAGIWPAFKMMSEASATGPDWGVVDIMENFGAWPYGSFASSNEATIHGPVGASAGAPDYNGGSGVGASATLPFGETVTSDYHIYALVWSQNWLEFFVDGDPYVVETPSALPAGGVWVFNAPFYLMMNLAIGGPTTWLGTPGSTETFPQEMLVDYVRVYQSTTLPATTPSITPGGVVNAASYLGGISPGSLATVFGNNLADAAHLISLSNGSLPTTVAGVTVSVNGVNAPLLYVSPTQINFQVPWETTPGLAVPVTVTWNSVTSSPENVTIASASSPSFFMSEYVTGTAWVTGAVADGCATPSTECAVKAGSTYQLWANGLGPMASPLQDGVPAPAALQMPGGPSSCQLTIGGQPATVVYCGIAPGEIIDQVNFTYPAGVSTSSSGGAVFVTAALTVNGVTGNFLVPAP